MSPSRKTAVASAGLAAALILLAGCSALPQPPAQPARYDFGLAPLSAPAQSATSAVPQARTPLALADVEAPALSDGSTAMFYRLAYANGQELRPYQLARWSQPPALLLQQRLRSQLGRAAPRACQQRSVAQPRPAGRRAHAAARGHRRVQPGLRRARLQCRRGTPARHPGRAKRCRGPPAGSEAVRGAQSCRLWRCRRRREGAGDGGRCRHCADRCVLGQQGH